MLSWAVCANVCAQAQTTSDSNQPSVVVLVPTPIVEPNAMTCGGDLYFTVKNYDPTLDYTWVLNTGSGAASASGVYTVGNPQDGVNYSLIVTATDKTDPTATASATASRYYVAQPEKPQITATHDCGKEIKFKLENTYPANYKQVWKVNGATVQTPTNGVYSFTNYSDGVNYELVVTVTNTVDGQSCVESSDPVSVKAKVVPTSPTVPGYRGCAEEGDGTWESLVTKTNASYSLKWYDSSSPTASVVVAPMYFDKNAVGSTSYWVTQVSSVGCESAKTEVKVTVDAVPVAYAGEDISICNGESAVLAKNLPVDTNVEYTWTPSGRLTSSNTYSVTTIPLYENTEFKLKVANKNAKSCYTEDYVKVNVFKKPEINLSPNKFTICEDDSVTVTNTKAKPSQEIYSWETITNGVTNLVGGTADLNLTSLGENTTIRLTASLSIEDAPECPATAEAPVTVIKRPEVNAGDDKFVCFGNSVQIGTTGITGVNYTWTPTQGLSNANIATPMVQNVTADKQYTLKASSNAVQDCYSTDDVWVYKVDKPTKYTLTGGGSYCEGSAVSGINITLEGSDSNTEYMLLRDGQEASAWIPGRNTVLEWFNVEAGTYRVKARKIGYNTCEEDMSNAIVVQAVSSPEAVLSLDNRQQACPGEEVYVNVTISGGVPDYKFTLLENGNPQEITIQGNVYSFPYTPTSATVFQVSEVSDQICSRQYSPLDYPTLDMNMSSLTDFTIHSSKNDKEVCYAEQVTLSVAYNEPGAIFEWSNLAETNSITIDALQDEHVSLKITTPEGCEVISEYDLKVIEKEKFTISGLQKSTTDTDGSIIYYFCSNDPNAPLSGVPGMGQFTSEPIGLIQNNAIVPSAVSQTQDYKVTYTYRNVQYGCEQDTTFTVYVSAINKEVDWTIAPALDRPWGDGPYEYCQPDPSNPKQSVPLQGYPQVAAGTWQLIGSESMNGGTAPSGAQVSPITGVPEATSNLTGIVAGNLYSIRYSVVDEFGCMGSKTKKIRVNGKSTTYFYSGGFNIQPNDTLCISLEEAIIQSNERMGNFILNGSDAGMKISDEPNQGRIYINPSKGKVGLHTAKYTIQHEGCSYSETVNFQIIDATRINSFNIPKEYCDGDEPQVITITSGRPTTGDIEIINQDGVTVLTPTPIESLPAFNPKWGAGTYTIIYHYKDAYCSDDYEETVVVHPKPEIDFQMKSDYCYGDKISIVPNYAGGTVTIDPFLPVETLVGNVFDTNISGIGLFNIGYEVTNQYGCVGISNTSFNVRGVLGMSLNVNEYMCEPHGVYEVYGFPSPDAATRDYAYFETSPAVVLNDNADGTATIDIENTTVNTTYPVTYNYVQEYDDAQGVTHSCKSSVTEYFKVLNEASDFSGFRDMATICADVLRVQLEANLPNNTTFTFSHSNSYPDAFVDKGDGTALLFPYMLPEDYYTVTMNHKYYAPDGTLVCITEKKKTFRISKIEEVKDISLFCDPVENKTAVKLNNTEVGIRYDLYINDALYDTYETTTIGEEVKFKAIDVPTAFASVYVMAVEPNTDACSLKLSKEYTVSPLHASVTSTNITCYGKQDGTFIGTVQGGEIPYSTILYNADTGAEVVQASTSVVLGKGNYEYLVTDNIGCYKKVPFEITEPNELQVLIEQTEVDCHGNTNATLHAQVPSNSGTSPYQYEWTKIDPTYGNVVVSPEATTVVGNGQYYIKVTDANNCVADKYTEVKAPEHPLTVTLDSKVDVQVIGDATGAINISVQGGTPGYTYSWTGNGITDANRNLEDLTDLVYGTYTVVVTDAKGCTATLAVYISQPSEIHVETTVKDATCFAQANGVISLNIAGGVAPYNIIWKDEAGNEIPNTEDLIEINGLVSGTYKYEILDANNNPAEDYVTVKENPELIVTTSLQSELNNKCHGESTAFIILNISGGTDVYNVEWQGLAPEKLESDVKAVGLPAKIYTINVKDTNGCSKTHQVEVTQPQLPLGLDGVNIVQNICHDGVSGSIDLQWQGGTPNYTYAWEGVGVNPTAQNQQGLKAGEKYTVRVTDANGCYKEEEFEMTNPKELTLSLKAEDIKCFGVGNGSIEATVTGELPVSYAWQSTVPGATFADVSKITCQNKGIYTVTVTDKLGCTITAGEEIKEPTEVTARVESTNITCNDANDGIVKVFAEGGSGIYTYALYEVGNSTPISTSSEQARLKEGGYQYKVQDEKDCSWVSNVFHIKNPDPIEIKYNVTNVSIYGGSNGIIALNVVGGTAGLTGYKIQWIDGPSIVTDTTNPAYNADKNTITNLAAGKYTVVVTDENQCAAMVDIEVTQPEIITLDIKVNDVRCYGQNTGSIILSNIKGGIAPYTITWAGLPDTDERVDGLVAGNYDLKIEDSAGAKFEKTIEVKQPKEIEIKTITELSKLSVDCFGNSTGEITIEILGGTAPYNYKWVGVTEENVENVKDLPAGTYSILLTDANNCLYDQYSQEIKGPVGKLTISESIVENKCYGENNAQIEINVTGGTAPYTYLWTGAGIPSDKIKDQNQYNLYNGESYKVTVIDDLKCTLEKVFTLGKREEMLIATSSKDVLCNGNRTGELHATISGGTGPVSYGWESNDGSYSSSELDINTLYAGKYIFKAKDSAGCEVVKEEIIDEPDVLTATLPADFALCGGIDDGELYVTVDGGTKPYTYLWHKDYDDVNPVGFGAHLTNLGAGIYQVFIKDRNGCEASDDAIIKASVPMNIIRKSIVNVSYNGFNDGSIEIEATGGTDPLTYTWSGPTIDPNVPVTGQSLTHLVAGYYYVTVEDAVGCKITERFEITQPEELTVEATIDDIKCAGDLGKILLRVDGGTPNYTYEWTSINGYSNSTTNPEVTGLLAGVYDVTIKDSKGAETKRQYIISEKDPVEWTLLTSKTELDCFEQNIANINLHVAGGTLPYSIEWKGPNYTNSGVYSIGNLGVGTYTAEIIDANGCKPAVMFSQEITQPTEIVFVENLTHNICTNDKSGKIELNITGGVEPYSFTWSGFEVKVNEQNQENLPQGLYTLYFADANNCEVKKEYKIQANNEISAIISGPSDICSREEFNIQIDVNGQAPWIIEYTDGFQTYSVTTEENINIFTHSLLSDSEFKLISVVDANGCSAKLSNGVQVDVHEIPQITIVSAQEDCCLGEPALVDIIFAGKGPWTINYTDGALDYVDGPFTADRDYLKIIPTQIGTKTYTIKSVSNNNCSVPIDYSVDITAYTYPNLEVNVSPYICEPNPLQVSLHATGEAPWHVVYYLNDLKYEYDMQAEDEVIDIYPNKPENVFLFESIKSGKRCVSKLDKKINSEMGLLPKDATTIFGQNMVCRNSIVSFSTFEIPYATSYKWSFPPGFNIVSGLGSTEVQVQVSSNAQDGEIRVWGVNSCGEGVYTAINVQVDKPMSAGAQITIPPFVCDDETVFPLVVSEVENATNYEWIMPTGYHVLSGQGTRSIMVKIDKYAMSGKVSVIPSNLCTEASPVTADILIRALPYVEAGVDFITDCSEAAIMAATQTPGAVSSDWRLVSGYADFESPQDKNSKVSGLMYGDNILSWNVSDGFCVGYDTVKVTNQNPGLTQPEFSELTICEDFMTLRAGKPEFGMGRWTLIAGDGEIQNPNSNETLITGLSNKRPNVIRWEVYSPQCSNSVNVEVISHDLNKLVDAGSDGVSTTGSYRLSARIVNDAEVTGTWTVEAGSGTFDDPHNPNTVISGLSTGINTIRWTLTGYDCIAYDEIKIRMVDEPIASFNIETTEGCVPLTVQFTNTTIGNADYKWEFGDGSSSDLRSPIHIFENPGTYTVKLTASANGRVDTYTGEVNVLPSPEAAFSVAERQLYVPNAEAHFYSETDNGVNHYWLFGDGGSSDKANPVYTYLADGLYDVTYIVSDINLCSDTLVMEDYIKVGKDSYLVFPTAFTPNVERSNGGLYSEGERRLDVFYPVGRNVDTYKLEIFSTWGNKVFESNDQYIGWDGYYMGQCAAQGVYLYRAEGRFKDGNSFQYSGNLMLIR